MNIYANGRFRAQKVTGVQRYAHEIIARLSPKIQVCQPRQFVKGWQSHLWEQTVLPMQSRGGLLWSPCAAGPLGAARHVVTFHDLFPIDSAEWYQKKYAMWRKITLSTLARTAEHLIAVSEYTKQRLVAHFQVAPSKVTVIHNGLDRKVFRPASAEERAAAAEALQLPSDRYLLCLGSLEPRKNLKRTLEAWNSVLGDLPSDLWIVIAGSKDASVFEDAGLGKLPPKVHFTGYVPETHLSGLYSGSCGFLFPSLGEGFGLPPLEAMACGVPVLTSSLTSLPEVCSNAALYVDPTNVSEIARGLRQLVMEPAIGRSLIQLGNERVEQFSWDRAASQTLTVFQQLMDRQQFARATAS